MGEAAAAMGEVDAILGLAPDERLAPLVRLGRQLVGASGDTRDKVVQAILGVIAEGAGTSRDRVELGEVLASLGDPRLKLPNDAGYWTVVETDDAPVKVGRFPVTNDEYRRFVLDGGYTRRELWSEEGWAWLRTASAWPVSAQGPESGPFVVANQPVVGVTWFEAEAYARAYNARLPRFDERLAIVRGTAKRPYPWGSPFGEGNANTREEVLGRPSAVGLFIADCTPEGVCDLAGNVAEWAHDGVGDQRFYSPGSFNEPSMAAWAKAREIERPDFASGALGFRLVRD